MAGVAGVGLAIALPSVITAVTIFYGLLAVALFVPFLLGLYWKRMNSGAALASIFAAIAGDLAVQYGTAGQSVGLLSAPAVGIFVGLVVAVGVSLAGPGREDESGGIGLRKGLRVNVPQNHAGLFTLSYS